MLIRKSVVNVSSHREKDDEVGEKKHDDIAVCDIMMKCVCILICVS